MRVVVDTNVWLSALLNPAGPPARVRQALEEARFTLVASAPLLEELARVMVRPRIARRYPLGPHEATRLLASLQERTEDLAPVTGAVRWCRAPRDDMVIETALNGHADVLVSRDDDLKRAPELSARSADQGARTSRARRVL